MSRSGRALGVLLMLISAASPAAALTRFVAFGDSITWGDYDSPLGYGYPPRLQSRLASAGRSASVANYGVPGETTSRGLTRIDSVLPSADAIILMEGTNDIFQMVKLHRSITVATMRFNLSEMATKADALAIETIHMSVIPLKKEGFNEWDPDMNPPAASLATEIASLAASYGRLYLDFYNLWRTRFPTTESLFINYYDQDPTDKVGHPRNVGYDAMALDIANLLIAVAAPPQPGATGPTGDILSLPTYVWSHATQTTWYHLEVFDALAASVIDEWYPAKSLCGASNCTIRPGGPLDPGAYTWRVTGRNTVGLSPVSTTLAFDYWPQRPAPVEPISPRDRIFAVSPDFLWHDARDAKRFRLMIDGQTSLYDAWHDALTVCSDGVCTVDPGLNFTLDETYSWHVLADNPAGAADPSPVIEFVAVDCQPADLAIGPGQLATEQLYETCGVITILDFDVTTAGHADIHSGGGVVVQGGTQIGGGGRMTIKHDTGR